MDLIALAVPFFLLALILELAVDRRAGDVARGYDEREAEGDAAVLPGEGLGQV